MGQNLANFLFSQHWMQVLRLLYLSKKPRGLREIADITELSIAGVQDILKRLEKEGLVSSAMNKNKREFILVISKEEEKLFKQAIDLDTKNKLKMRAEQISKKRKTVTSWIDETHKSLGKIRSKTP